MLVVMLRLFFGLVFIASGTAKLRSAGSFQHTLDRLDMLPARLKRPLVSGLPIAELLCGTALVAGLGTAFAATAGTLMLCVFTGAMIITVQRGKSVPCNCFGTVSDAPMSWRTVLRNAILIAMGSVVVIASSADVAGHSQSYPAYDLPLLIAVVVVMAILVLGRELRRFRQALARLPARSV